MVLADPENGVPEVSMMRNFSIVKSITQDLKIKAAFLVKLLTLAVLLLSSVPKSYSICCCRSHHGDPRNTIFRPEPHMYLIYNHWCWPELLLRTLHNVGRHTSLPHSSPCLGTMH
jgi:hypothetical protein